jgi:phosphoribosylglycinamide formyltransferase-1
MSKNKKKLRLAFYVSGNASRLLKLLEKKSPIIQDTIFVINDNPPNSEISQLFNRKKIQYLEVKFSDLGLKEKERNKYLSDILLEKLNEHCIDYCFCFGRRILLGELLNQFKNKIINFHPSILPMYPGEKSIDQALRNNAFLLGNTAHFIDKGVDTGPIIMQSIIHSNNYKNYESVLSLQIPMIEQIYSWIVDNRIVISNNKVHIVKANYLPTVFYPNIKLK